MCQVLIRSSLGLSVGVLICSTNADALYAEACAHAREEDGTIEAIAPCIFALSSSVWYWDNGDRRLKVANGGDAA